MPRPCTIPPLRCGYFEARARETTSLASSINARRQSFPPLTFAILCFARFSASFVSILFRTARGVMAKKIILALLLRTPSRGPLTLGGRR